MRNHINTVLIEGLVENIDRYEDGTPGGTADLVHSNDGRQLTVVLALPTDALVEQAEAAERAAALARILGRLSGAERAAYGSGISAARIAVDAIILL